MDLKAKRKKDKAMSNSGAKFCKNRKGIVVGKHFVKKIKRKLASYALTSNYNNLFCFVFFFLTFYLRMHIIVKDKNMMKENN